MEECAPVRQLKPVFISCLWAERVGWAQASLVWFPHAGSWST